MDAGSLLVVAWDAGEPDDVQPRQAICLPSNPLHAAVPSTRSPTMMFSVRTKAIQLREPRKSLIRSSRSLESPIRRLVLSSLPQSSLAIRSNAGPAAVQHAVHVREDERRLSDSD